MAILKGLRPFGRPALAALALAVAAIAIGLVVARRDARVLPVDPASHFDPDFRARAAEYAGLKYSYWAAATILRWGTLAGVISLGGGLAIAAAGRWLTPGRRRETNPRGGRGATFTMAILLGTLAVVTLPLSYASGYRAERAFGLSTQSPAAWSVDWLKESGFWILVYSALAAGFLACVRRWPRHGWLVAAAGGIVVAIAATVFAPRVIDPLFHNFAPLADEDLEGEIVALGSRAGIDIGRVRVMDASRRTRRLNAYVTGLGATRQVVLYDNLLENAPRDELLLVVAHEIGHEAGRHVWKGLLWTLPGIVGGAWILARLARWQARRDSRLEGPGDPAVLPLLWLAASILLFLSNPVASAISRRMEAEADWMSLQLTRDPVTFVEVEKRLTRANLSAVTPPGWIVTWLYTHPPIVERIGMAAYWQAVRGGSE